MSVRRGQPNDLEVAARMNRAMDLHIQMSPSFGRAHVGSLEEYLEDWSSTWDDQNYVHLVAESEGAVVGQVLLYYRPSGDLRVPQHSIDLAQAYVDPSRRGTGVIRALMNQIHHECASNGIEVLITDWRAGNVPAARVWPAFGFTETFRRLHRSISPSR